MTDRFAMTARGDFHECIDAFVEAVEHLRRRDPLTPIVALVGSHQLREHLRELLHRRIKGGVFGVWLITFHDLADRLGRPTLEQTGRREASPLVRHAFVAQALAANAGYFAPVRDYDGTAAALVATFTDLEEATWPAFPIAPPRGGKAATVARLFDSYRRALAEEFFTPQDTLAAAAENAPDFVKALGAPALHVVGVYDANRLQTKLLTALAEVVELRFYLPDTLFPPELARQVGGGEATAHTPDREALRVWSCPTETAEVETIVRQVKHLHDKGVGYHEMAVLLRQPDVYADLFCETCHRAGIALDASALAGAGADPTIRALRQLLRLVGARDGRARVMSFLGAAEFPDDAQPQRAWRETRSSWEQISRAARIKADEDWDRRLRRYAKNAPEAGRVAASHLRAAAARLHQGLAAVVRAGSYGEAVKNFIALAEVFIAPNETRRQALAALAELGAVDRTGFGFDLTRFKAWAAGAIRRQAAAMSDPGGLRLLDLVAARGMRYRYVFLPGCVEAMIPRPQRQDPILLDVERERLAADAGTPGALPCTAELAQEELRLFDFALRTASDATFLSFPRLDAAQGRQRFPSHLLLELAGRLTGASLTFDELAGQDFVEVIPAGRFAPADPAQALDRAERDLAIMAPLSKLTAVQYLLHARPVAFSRFWRRQLDRFAAWDRLTPSEGLVDDPRALALTRAWADEKAHWSVSELESYVLCPRRYLFERVLKLDAPDDPEAVVALPPTTSGTLLHKVMERLESRTDPAFETEAKRLTRELYRRCVEDNLTGGGELDNAESERLHESMHAMLELAHDQSAGFKLRQTEEEFLVDIATPDAPLRVKGYVDRLDESATGEKRIVDYKTGAAKSKFTDSKIQADDFNAGLTLQAPLYALAYLEQTDEAPEAAYWFLKNHKKEIAPNALTFSAEALRQSEDVLRSILADIRRGVREGKFVPRPDVAGEPDNQYCANCGFTVLCDARARALLAAKPALDDLYPWLEKVGRFDE